MTVGRGVKDRALGNGNTRQRSLVSSRGVVSDHGIIHTWTKKGLNSLQSLISCLCRQLSFVR